MNSPVMKHCVDIATNNFMDKLSPLRSQFYHFQ